MSLNVPAAMIEQAQAGEVRTSDFLQCIKESLPYAWQLIEGLIARLNRSDAEFVDNQVPPPSEEARGQLLRVLASDSMRGAIEQHYGVKLAFQNCHRVAVFRKDQLGSTYEEFITPRSQILNQTPELRDC
ncbi:MAG TPA: SCO5389 family protein [Ktedonosporobacter sp.]|nr:SCO5389 family protein [Ktedonosporobacter sp.]